MFAFVRLAAVTMAATCSAPMSSQRLLESCSEENERMFLVNEELGSLSMNEFVTLVTKAQRPVHKIVSSETEEFLNILAVLASGLVVERV